MKRTINRATKKFQLILSADWHLRDDVPQCRERDEYLAAQERKLKFIHGLCVENGATLLIAGDIFDCTGNDQKGYWKPTPEIISLAIRYIPPGTIVVPGQHDMVARNMKELGKTGLQTLAEAGVAIILSGGLRSVLGHSNACLGAVYGWAFGEEAQNPPKGDEGVKILMWHRLMCAGKQPWPGAEALQVNNKNMMGFDLVVTGDNHASFVCGNWVNSGSMMRMASDQKDFCPAVYGWKEDGSITRIPLPIKEEVVKTTSNKTKDRESRDQRMEAYVKKASAQFETRLSFTKNLEQHFRSNKERPGVEQIVWKACENSQK
jgi:hypothetical protein